MHISPLLTSSSAIAALVGGVGIGCAASIYTYFNKDTMPSSTFNWYTTTGMLAASALVSGVVGPGLAGASFFEASFLSSASLPWLAGCGALVGLGSGMGKGCTSGNGIQGLACCSKASLAFVMIFMAGSGVAAALVDQSAALAPVPSVFSTNLALVQLGLLLVQGAFGWMATEMEPTDRLLPVSNVAAGAGFAVSLVQASMVKPSKVLGFLNFAGPLGWDPSLAFVMGGGVLVALPLFQLGGLVKSGSAELQAFAARPIDAATVIGGALFGAGWGLSGLCPGPGIVGAGAGSLGSAVWMCSMFGAREAVSRAVAAKEAGKAK